MFPGSDPGRKGLEPGTHPGVREDHLLLRGDLKQRTPVQRERFPDAALGGLDRAAHLVGGQRDKARREVGQQPLEL